jgi:hypothetical protein
LANPFKSSSKQVPSIGLDPAGDPNLIQGLPENSSHVYKEVPVNNFSGDIGYIPAKLTPLEARDRITDAISVRKFKFPNKIDSAEVLSKTRGVLVPYWARSGEIDAKWQATGILVEDWKVACTRCRGSGRIGRGKKNSTCPTCYGKRTERRSKDNKTVEKGSAAISLGPELVPNVSQFFGFRFAPDPMQEFTRLSVQQRNDFQCLKPEDFMLESEQKKLTADLVSLWKSKVMAGLGSYDRIENLSMLDDENAGSSRLSVVLYPAYLTWYSIGKKHFFIVCDAITGEVQLPSTGSHIADKIAENVLEISLIVLALGLLMFLLKT